MNNKCSLAKEITAGFEALKSMRNNEPVAFVDNVWINRPDLAIDLGIGQMFSRCQLSDHQIPLYTHPVKDLTDEEIIACTGCLPKYNSEIVDEDLVKFARAILKKAQEI